MTLNIDQAPEHQAQRAVEVLLHRCSYVDTLPDPIEVPFTLYSRENA